jgi:hypothetical protein
VPARWWLGEYLALGKTFYNLLFKQEVVAAPVPNVLPYLIPREGLCKKYNIIITQ